MKRTILSFLLITAALCASMNAQTVVGSRHDLSSGGPLTDKSTNESQVCIFCHTPHQTGMTAIPLWNKTLSTVASYGTYSGLLMNATPAEIGGGTGVSNLCMSCHDGTVAVNSLGNPSSVGNPAMGSGTELDATGKIASSRSSNLGNNLTNDHPVNFTYDAALATADGHLVTPTSSTRVDPAGNFKLFPSGSQTATLQCASCHDAHNASGQSAFLPISNNGSAVCRACHNK
jgi:predicted CXXCH cytochrome family protein